MRKTILMIPVLFGAAALQSPVHAMADGEFLECAGNSAVSGYPVPQPSPSESAVPGPAPSVSASLSPLADVASPVPGPSTIPSTLFGVTIRPERNNQGLLAADIYQLTEQGQWIKQVGHAEVDPPAGADGSAGDNSRIYQSDPGSPFPFQLTVSRDQVTLVQAGLFSGDTLTNLSLDCRHGFRHGR